MQIGFNPDFKFSIIILDHYQIKIRIDTFKSGLDSDCGYRFWCIKFPIEIFKSGLNLDFQPAFIPIGLIDLLTKNVKIQFLPRGKN